jgi:Nif-specific regulatory protein
MDDALADSTGQKVRVSRKIPIREKWESDAKTVFTLARTIADEPKAFRDPKKRLSLILTLSSEIISSLDYHELMEKALDISMKIMDAERGFLALKNPQGKLVYSGLRGFDADSRNLRVSGTMIDKVMKEGHSILTANAVMEDTYSKAKSVLTYKLKSVMCVPLRMHHDIMGFIYLDNPRKVGSFTPDDLDFLTILAHQIAIAIDNARLHKKVRDEKAALESRLRLQEKIIVKSEKMIRLFQDIQKVAESNIPVLILGETGTGKELVALATHNFSTRGGKFIALNCSAIPENLLESELFGHEKGAFTGAVTAKPGMFELAQGGTIFLDEIGDMSPLLQPKLLRVLQDKKVMRLGGTKHTKIDVRVVSATHKDLKAMMKKDTFRQDLYYRLAGVELKVSSLRERKEDIPPLANCFLLRFSEEYDRKVSRISHKAMKMMIEYDWPGNINELKNAVQRALLLGDGRTINPDDLPQELQEMETRSLVNFPSMETMEKRHIRKALQRADGNKKKAAQLLGIARDTMYKKIEKYGIDLN